jgi:hypothetical protein
MPCRTDRAKVEIKTETTVSFKPTVAQSELIEKFEKPIPAFLSSIFEGARPC